MRTAPRRTMGFTTETRRTRRFPATDLHGYSRMKKEESVFDPYKSVARSAFFSVSSVPLW